MSLQITQQQLNESMVRRSPGVIIPKERHGVGDDYFVHHLREKAAEKYELGMSDAEQALENFGIEADTSAEKFGSLASLSSHFNNNPGGANGNG